MRILSLDGGGTRAVYTIHVLEHLENILNKSGESIHTYFDFVSGTSTGSILALGIAYGIPLKVIKELYYNYSKEIFKMRFPYYNFNKGQEVLRVELKKLFTDINGNRFLISDAKLKVLIPIYNLGEGRINVIKTPHHEKLVNDKWYFADEIALAASSAPVYFKPSSIEHSRSGIFKHNLLDAGIFANNPSVLAYLEAITVLNIPINKLNMISIGTGSYTKQEIYKKNFNLIYWCLNLIDILFNSQSIQNENLINYLVGDYLGEEKKNFNYLRLNSPLVKKIKLNTYSKQDFNYLESEAQTLVKEKTPQITKFIQEATYGIS